MKDTILPNACNKQSLFPQDIQEWDEKGFICFENSVYLWYAEHCIILKILSPSKLKNIFFWTIIQNIW